MDSDEEASNDDNFICDCKPGDLSPFPANCPNEAYGIESLSKCFMDRYNACPVFLMESLRDACQKALHSPMIKERRPVLVYIHHDKSQFSNIFCWNVFCSEKMIEYLLGNYIVWPWDITYESNRNTLTTIWNDIFPIEVSLDFSNEQYPMLIGIMRRSAEEKYWSSSPEYQLQPILKGDTLTRTQEKFSPTSVLNELSLLKKAFDENEQALSLEFITKTGLSWEIIVEICKYLSLNDAINALSLDILFFLRQSKSKVHITEPCDIFLDTIARKIKPEQVVSLCLNTDEFWLKKVFALLPMFKQVISLTLLNLHILEQISEYKIYFPNLTCLSLRYDNEIGFNVLKNIFPYLPNSIRRFEIHSAGALCTHYDKDQYSVQSINYSVKSFLLDMGQYSLVSTNECVQHHRSCFLMTAIDLMQYMLNIRYFHLIINQYDLVELLDINDWKFLDYCCHSLKKVTLQVLGNKLQVDKLLSEKVMELQHELYGVRKKIKFQVIVI